MTYLGLPRVLEYSSEYRDQYSSRKLLVSGSPRPILYVERDAGPQLNQQLNQFVCGSDSHENFTEMN